MTYIHEKIRMMTKVLSERITLESKPVENVLYVESGYKSSNNPPETGWENYDGHALRTHADAHMWFRFPLDVPTAEDGFEYRLKICNGNDGPWDGKNPQCVLYVDGDTAFQAFDINHTVATLTPGHHEIVVYYYTGMVELYAPVEFYLRKIDLRVEKLYYDLYVPYDCMKQLPTDSNEYHAICNALDRATMLLDFRVFGSKDYYDSIEATDQFLATEFYGKVCGKDTEHEFGMIGHTHIDVAWRWTLAQTVEKAQRSFSTVIRLMDQYPDYIFMSSQPQLYEFVKETDPKLYEKIKKRVKEGRWEVDGAMWLEADTNLISGESLVRQILIGKQFMQDEFGVESKTLWLPDVFGYSAALPQILKKSDVPTFFTCKMSWSETNKFPHEHFIWQGLDGSEVFAVLNDTYVRKMDAASIANAWKIRSDKKFSSEQTYTAGFGDGGGGTTPDMIETYERMKYGIPGFPKITMRPAKDTIAIIKEQFDKSTAELRFTPKWSGELYLETHRGTYTSMAANKKFNRKCEFLYENVEKLALTESVFYPHDYPAELLKSAWKTILKNQFHDIIPGSSIKEVYDVSHAEYRKLLADGTAETDASLDRLSGKVKTDGGVFVYNPTGFTADGLIDTKDGKRVVRDIPANGWKVVKPESPAGTVTVTDKSLENDLIRVTFNDRYQITSLFDKRADREVISAGECANVFEVYEDYPRAHDAWEISEYFQQKKWIADDVDHVELIRDGAFAGIRVTRKYSKSVIEQTIGLREGSARLDFNTYVDWHEDHVLLKAAFPVDVRSPRANYEIQFGHIDRPTHRNTSWDQAKFEVCAHKWADLSDSGYGVSMLNDCKYGYSIQENVMRISLLKAATDPNPVADRGEHTFTYSILPHDGVLGEETIREGYLLNNPLQTRELGKQTGKLPAEFSFVTSDDTDFVIETCKRAEDGNGWVVRGYESNGRKCRTNLTFGFPLSKVLSCNLIERDGEELPFNGKVVPIKANPYEIVTIKVFAK